MRPRIIEQLFMIKSEIIKTLNLFHKKFQQSFIFSWCNFTPRTLPSHKLKYDQTNNTFMTLAQSGSCCWPSYISLLHTFELKQISRHLPITQMTEYMPIFKNNLQTNEN